ncbi:hypothetical protein LEM8419_00183 [Neolewinella maritima]|uniref:Antitoxin n=1 Tax=Neolewinella maritima TaxID=1383882 RepID=A0ABN8F483_9BACT|nr:type II toxin-antitoxin system prevent-host-death family antitoxin [Neolewinella maritima]CAH0998868.1 hypothetical protein LEM8419_00183 [Neolewinella maritima]
MQAITVSKFRSNMKHYLDEVEDSSETILIPRSGERKGVVLMGLSEYNSLMETMHLRSSPANHQRLLESIAEAERGELRTVPIEEIDRMVEERITDGD